MLQRSMATEEIQVEECRPMSVGNRMLIAASHLTSATQANDRSLGGVEKMALYYITLSIELGNARQLREFAVQAANRLSPWGGRDKV